MNRETNLNEIVGIVEILVEMLNFFYIQKILEISMGFEQHP